MWFLVARVGFVGCYSLLISRLRLEAFYKHVEALSVTPFSARALDRGLAGVLVALMRLRESRLNANIKAGDLQDTDPAMPGVIDRIVSRAEKALGDPGRWRAGPPDDNAAP